ncbi:MAG: hypothetical protein HY263_10500 [Chloroflexi bacterium]|nr:hypothetical protein [Chloroflexota bacterium]
MRPRSPGSVRFRAVLAAGMVAVLVVGCDLGTSTRPTLGPDGTLPLDSVPDTSPGPGDTPGPGDSGSAGIPGFDGWQTINAQDVQIAQTESGLAMTLTRRALWFQTSRGVLFYTLVTGDFRVTATVQTSRTSDSSQEPGGDGTVQLAGLMARAQTPQENYVFVVVGSDANGLSVETKSTTNGSSTFAGPAWPSGDAVLKLCRAGTTFTLWKQASDGSGDFALAATYRRPDLAGELQVGATIYSDSTPDITAVFPDLTIEPLDPGEAC